MAEDEGRKRNTAEASRSIRGAAGDDPETALGALLDGGDEAALERCLTGRCAQLPPERLVALLHERPPGQRKRLLRAVRKVYRESLRPLLEAGLSDPIERVREYAVRGLAAAGTPEAAKALLQALDDPSRRIRLTVVRCIANERIVALRRALQTHSAGEHDPEVRRVIDWAVERLQGHAPPRRPIVLEHVRDVLGEAIHTYCLYGLPGLEQVVAAEVRALGGIIEPAAERRGRRGAPCKPGSEERDVPGEPGAVWARFRGLRRLALARTVKSAWLLLEWELPESIPLRSLGPFFVAKRHARMPAPFDPAGRGLADWLSDVAEVTPYRTAGTKVRPQPRGLLIEVLPEAAFRRPYRRSLGPTSLDPALAAAMVRLTEPAPSDRFLDPMCGTGTLPIERALIGPAERILGGDRSEQALERARANAASAKVDIAFQAWDATRLPLSDGSVDKIAVDLPFGRRSGSHQGNERLYPAFIAELARVLCPSGKGVLLAMQKRLLRRAIRAAPGLELSKELVVQVGGLMPTVFVVCKP